jgi:hypothetical protein
MLTRIDKHQYQLTIKEDITLSIVGNIKFAINGNVLFFNNGDLSILSRNDIYIDSKKLFLQCRNNPLFKEYEEVKHEIDKNDILLLLETEDKDA